MLQSMWQEKGPDHLPNQMVWSRNPHQHSCWSVLYSQPVNTQSADHPSQGWVPPVPIGLTLCALLCFPKGRVHPLQHFSCVCCLTTPVILMRSYICIHLHTPVVALLPRVRDAACVCVQALQRGSCPDWLPRRGIRAFPMVMLTKSCRSFRVCPFVPFLVSSLFLYLLP